MIEIDILRANGEYGFDATDAVGHRVQMDTSPDGGGANYGVRPMQLLLMALGGCSGIDIVSILKKQRQTLTAFNMKISGERVAGKEPSLWESIHIVFEMSGKIERERAIKACQLSVDKYCSVAETLRGSGTTITWELNVTPLA